ncbi:MAG: EamA family transporter [Coriobacteriia bacterium]
MPRDRRDTKGLTLAAVSVTFGAIGQLLMKGGTAGLAGEGVLATLASALLRPQVLLGLAAYALSSVMWLVVLSRLDLAAVYPLGSASYAIVVVASWALGESVGPLRWLGVVLIVAGVVLVSWGPPARATVEAGQ